MRRLVAIALVSLLAGLGWAVTPARAESTEPCVAKGIYASHCKVSASRDPISDDKSDGVLGVQAGISSKERARRQAAWLRDVAARYQAQLARYNGCMSVEHDTSVCPAPERVRLQRRARGAATPLITPGQAGAIAVARLQLPLNPPRVGPDPSLNKWKIAAVGYPLWLSTAGPTHLGPVADRVGGLSVSLEADLVRTDFRMGDGGRVSCAGAGTPYHQGIEPGTPSPDCGYRYQQPSLPEGDYTISAVSYWAVTWTINNTSGVVTVPRQASTQLPVGEIQVLIR